MALYEIPTVRIAVELRVRAADGSGRWEWKRCEVQPEAEDFIYTHSDMCAALRGYATLASYAIPAGKYPAWRIVIRGCVTGCTLATYEWAWDEMAHRYVPNGTPFCWWPPLEVLPDHVLVGAARHRERPFTPARICGADAPCLMATKGPERVLALAKAV